MDSLHGKIGFLPCFFCTLHPTTQAANMIKDEELARLIKDIDSEILRRASQQSEPDANAEKETAAQVPAADGTGSEPTSHQHDDAVDDAVLVNPHTGAIIDEGNYDQIFQHYQEIKAYMDMLNDFRLVLLDLMWSKTEGTAKTRRLRGKTTEAVLVDGDKYPSQSILKHLVEKYPEESSEYIKVSQYKVAVREFKKLLTTSCESAVLQEIKDQLTSMYENASKANPTVNFEKI